MPCFSLSENDAPESLEMTSITRKLNRGTKGVREGRKEKRRVRSGGHAGQMDRGGAEIRHHRKQKEGGREGRRDGLTRISAPWLLGLGVTLTLTQNTQSTLAVTNLRTDQERRSGNPHQHIFYYKAVFVSRCVCSAGVCFPSGFLLYHLC